MACPINRNTVRNGILKNVKDRLNKSKLFTESDGFYTPIELTSNYEDTIEEINTSFNEDIIMPLNGPDVLYTVTEPSDQLLNKYMNEAPAQVLAPNGEPSKLFDSILNLPAVADETEAKRIYAMTKTPAFKQWFGDSKVVDENGEPRIVFHGTGAEFDTFDKEKLGSSTQHTSSKIGFFASASDYVANLFTPLIQNPDASSAWYSFIPAPNAKIMPLFMKMENPKIMTPQEFSKVSRKIEEIDFEGHDGLLIKGDPSTEELFGGSEYIADNFAVFEPNQIKSPFNRGSFISNENKIDVDPQYPRFDSEDYSFRVDVKDNGRRVGEINVTNDGEYLNVFMSQIAKLGSENVGTNAYMKLAQYARDNGLMLRSDAISNRMSDAAQRLWNRFVEAGQAEILNGHYVFTGEPQLVGNNIYMSASPLETIRPEQQEIVSRMQNTGVLGDPSTVDGATYYPVKSKERFNTIKDATNADFIHLVERVGGIYATLGTTEKPLVTTETDTTSTKAGAITKAKVLRFLDNIGFRNIQMVSQLVYRGEKIPGSAYVDFATGVMQIVNGQEDYSLPEESMHILLKLIQENNPSLYNSMKREVVNYKLYRDVVNDPAYTNNPLYQTEEGTLDYDKIKEEAVAKLLSEYLISELEGTPESQAKLVKIHTWWQDIIDWIRELFGSYKNPFQDTIAELQRDDTSFGDFTDISDDDIFFSTKSNEKIDGENPISKDIFNRIKSRPNEIGIKKVQSDTENGYVINGVKVPDAKRVSAIADRYNKSKFGSRNFDAAQEAFYKQAAKDGTYIHLIMEELIKSYVDPVTGLARKTPAPLSFPIEKGNVLQAKILAEGRDFLKKFVAMYPQGTRFITEQVVYDPNVTYKVGNENLTGRIGTIDFLAILPDGTVDIIDWKSSLFKGIEVVKDYKKGAYHLQLNEYKRILKEEYGVENFGKIRAIPIKMHHKTDKEGKRELVNIEIGNANAAAIGKNEVHLRPVISAEETTGSETRDEMVQKLEALYNKYIEKKYFQGNRDILTEVQESIYEIRVSNSVDNLANYFNDLKTKIRQVVAESNKLENASKEDVSEALAMITFYQDIIDHVVKPATFLIEDGSIEKESRKKLFTASSELNLLSRGLDKVRNKLLDSQAKKEGIFNLLLPEKVVNLARRYFRSMGSQNIATVRFMYELVKKAYNRIDLAVDTDLTRLKNLKYDFDQWKKKQGIDDKAAIGMFIDYKKGVLYSKISSSFYAERQKIVENRDAKATLKFIQTNYDLTEYNQWYKDRLEENKKQWEATTYDVDKTKDARIKKTKLAEFEKNYNINKHPITAFGWHNPKVWSTKNIKGELWESEEYKKIKAIPELSAMYDFFIEKNQQLAETGAIRDYEAYTFLPNVRKSYADIMAQEDISLLKKAGKGVLNELNNFQQSLTVNDYELNFQGKRDAFTGEKLNQRFVPYVTEIENDEKSFDLFTIYGLMSKQIHKEQYLKENDEILRNLLHIEKMKPNILQNAYGKVAKDPLSGKPKVAEEVGKNSKILEEHIRAVVNGESLQYDADYAIQMRVRESWNKSPLGKLYKFDINPETYEPNAISTTKFLMWLNNANQKRILGLNAASAISNLFGGSFASSRLYKKYLSNEDLQKSWTKMTSGAFYANDEMKKNAALVDFFLPLLNNREDFKASQLSVSQASQVLSQEWLMMPMRKTSEIVQLNIFLALVENTGIINGKMVNIREHLSKEMNYEGRYELSTAERIALENEFEKKVKQLKATSNLAKVAQFKTIKEAGKDKIVLDIPGFDRNSPEVAHLRDITQTMAKDSLGEADEFDLANYKYSIWWRLFMTFKNWIPRQADVRFGEFRYDQAHHSYEYGRFRMFYRSLSANYIETLARLVPLPYITSKVANATFGKELLIKRAKEVYQIKVADAKELGTYNPDTFISQGEFIDRFVQGTESTFEEVRTIIFMMSIMFMGLAAADDDDDSETKSVKALIRRQVEKLTDEVGFFYNPKSGIDIAGGGLPMFSIVRDGYGLVSHVGEQFFGYTFENIGMTEKGVEMQESAKPIKRTFKMIPVLKEILTYLPAVDEETAKEWGVRVSDRRAF